MLLVDSGEFYIVQLDNGTYYKGGGVSLTDVRTTKNINNARLYSFDWQVLKDLYFRMYIEQVETGYQVLKVYSKRSVEIIESN